jgi:hypothetical protein
MKALAIVLLMFLGTGLVQIHPARSGESNDNQLKTAPAAPDKAQQRRESMRKFVVGVLTSVWTGIEQPRAAWANEFQAREAKIAQYKRWLDTVGPKGSQYWVRLDSRQRPHRLYLGEGFYRADYQSQERFIDTYSSYLAGHPEKFMLIDLFDAETNRWVGEYGFGGFKLYPKPIPGAQTVQKSTR